MVIMKKTFLEWLTAVGVKECKCHICKSNTSEEYVCEICDEYYCEYCQEAVENKYRY